MDRAGIMYSPMEKSCFARRPIRVRIESAQRLSLRADGSLLLATSAGDLTFKAPQIYQLKNDRKVAIEGRFALRGPNEFGFELTLRRHS